MHGIHSGKRVGTEFMIRSASGTCFAFHEFWLAIGRVLVAGKTSSALHDKLDYDGANFFRVLWHAVRIFCITLVPQYRTPNHKNKTVACALHGAARSKKFPGGEYDKIIGKNHKTE